MSIIFRLPVFLSLALAAASLPARQPLPGTLRPEFTAAPRLGNLDPAKRLDLVLGLRLPDKAGLDAFIADRYDPHSPNYRRFLKPSAFAGRFGPSPADYQALIDFLKAQGLAVTATYTSRLLLHAVGSVDQVQKAFHVTVGRRRRPDGSECFAPDQEASMDLDLPGLNVVGLDNFYRRRHRSHPHARPAHPLGRNSSGRTPRNGTGGDAYWGWAYQGDDFRDAYVPNVRSTLLGTGQSIASLPLGTLAQEMVALLDAPVATAA